MSADTLRTLSTSMTVEAQQRAQINGLDASGETIGQPHTAKDLRQAQAHANFMSAAAEDLGSVETGALELGGVAVAATVTGGLWRRRRTIAAGARRAAGVVAHAARVAWDALNEPIGPIGPLPEPAQVIENAAVQTIVLPRIAERPADDMFGGTLQPNTMPSGLDIRLGVGFTG